MVINELRGGQLVKRIHTGKVYRVYSDFAGAAIITVNEHGIWVTVKGQRDGRDYGRLIGFRVDELEASR